MVKRVIEGRIAAFEQEYDYDMSYAREILAAGVGPIRRFNAVGPMSREQGPIADAPWFAAKIAAAMHEDCGPCTQLVVRMAERAGVDAGLIRAVLRNDEAQMPDDVRATVRYTRAAVAHAAELPSAIADVVARWGRRGLVSLALTITGSRMYPMLKYALGYGHACTHVDVGGERVAPGARPVTV